MKHLIFILFWVILSVSVCAQYTMNNKYIPESEFIKDQIVKELDAVIMTKNENKAIEIILLDNYYSFTLVKLKIREVVKSLDPVLRIINDPWEYNDNGNFYCYLIFTNKSETIFKLKTTYTEIEDSKFIYFILSSWDTLDLVSDTLQNDTVNLKSVDN